MAKSVIEAEYPNIPKKLGFLGLAEAVPKSETDSLADANLFTDPRKLYYWGYTETYANLPFTAGYILVIPHTWGVTQIAFEYNNSNLAVRGKYVNNWTAWKQMFK